MKSLPLLILYMAFSELIKKYPKFNPVIPQEEPGNIKSKLQKLKDLYEQSLITEDEYKFKKEEILKAI